MLSMDEVERFRMHRHMRSVMPHFRPDKCQQECTDRQSNTLGRRAQRAASRNCEEQHRVNGRGQPGIPDFACPLSGGLLHPDHLLHGPIAGEPVHAEDEGIVDDREYEGADLKLSAHIDSTFGG